MRTLTLPPRGFGVPHRVSRLLFAWEAADGSLTARTGQVGTFTRATIGTAVDAAGRSRQLVHSQPRWSYVDTDGDGVRDVHLLMEDQRTNLVVQSDALATGWATSGAPNLANAAATFAGRPFSLIAAVTLGDVARAVTLTGDGTKAFSILLHAAGTQGTAYAGLLDNVAGVWRCRVAYTVFADGSITAVAVNGALIGVESWGDGVYRILMSAPGCIAANQHSAYANASNTATLPSAYASGVQVEDGPFPSSLIPTTTATVTRNPDVLTFPFNAPPQALTVYIDYVSRATLAGTTPYIAIIGNPIAGLNAIQLPNDVGQSYARAVAAGNTFDSTIAPPPAFGERVESVSQYAVAGITATIKQLRSINGAAPSSGAVSGTFPLPSAWDGQTLCISPYGTAWAVIRSVRVAAGVRSLEYMRSAG